MKKIEQKNRQKEKGIAILLALVVIGIITLLVFSISNIALKDLTVSESVRKSQQAFYTTDSAIECALYYLFDEIFTDDGIDLDDMNENEIEDDCSFDDIGLYSDVEVYKEDNGAYITITISAFGFADASKDIQRGVKVEIEFGEEDVEEGHAEDEEVED